jgi:hypothetical protein
MATSMPDAVGIFEKRLLGDLASKIEEWSRWRQELTRWEGENLQGDSPSPTKLEEHRRMLERLIFFGQIFGFVNSHPDFPDTELAEMVHANQFTLREKFQMFHNPMSQEDVDKILKEVFPESSL